MAQQKSRKVCADRNIGKNGGHAYIQWLRHCCGQMVGRQMKFSLFTNYLKFDFKTCLSV